ncbi:MAG: 23S rRNA (guanosine(2251)-2'-O)-methyltransferase RlmB [Candidatus Comchoanobacterales bacterium]
MKHRITNRHTMAVIAEYYPERVVSVSVPDHEYSDLTWVPLLQKQGIAIHRSQHLVMIAVPPSVRSELDLLTDVQSKHHGCWLALDEVTDPHNLGACLRNIAALGAQGLVLPKHGSAQVNDTVRNISCGGADFVPIYQVTNLSKAMSHLKKDGVWVFGGCERGEQSLGHVKIAEKSLIVMGSEGKGMRPQVRKMCDVVFHLPTCPPVLSLNVSVATGLALNHWLVGAENT